MKIACGLGDFWPANFYKCHPIAVFIGPPYMGLFTHISPKTSRPSVPLNIAITTPFQNVRLTML